MLLESHRELVTFWNHPSGGYVRGILVQVTVRKSAKALQTLRSEGGGGAGFSPLVDIQVCRRKNAPQLLLRKLQCYSQWCSTLPD